MADSCRLSSRLPRRNKFARSCLTGALLFALVGSLHAQAQRIITTIAGTGWIFPGDGRPALQAPLGGNPFTSVAVDQHGNYFIADPDCHMVMKVNSDGILTVIAGNGITGYSGDGGLATDAALGAPVGVAVDLAGNVYIADAFEVVRKVTPRGIITTIAGTGDSGFSGDGRPATQALLRSPRGIAVNTAGEVFIADRDNHRVRKVRQDGMIETVAGSGVDGYTGDGGLATAAALSSPASVAVDAAGNLFIADTQSYVVRRVGLDNRISTVAGGGNVVRDGVPATQAAMIPLSIALDTAGNLYVCDFLTGTVRRISGGMITTVAGSGEEGYSGDGGPALRAALNVPTGVAAGAGGIYFADSGNSRIRRVNASGVITTVAGSGLFRSGGDGGPATSAVFYQPNGLAADPLGNVYVSEPQRNRIRRIAADGTISLLAGTSESGFSGDNGPAASARLFQPTGLAADAQGNVYVADRLNSRIRKISGRVITTVAGNGRLEFSGDNGPATAASLNGPSAVALDSGGNLFISDTGNQRIRRVDAYTGIITTFAGNGQTGVSGDSGAAVDAALNNPAGLAVDASGSVYVADSGNHRIRRIANGVITTVAGDGRKGFSGDGMPATNASLNGPVGLVIDSSQKLYIADQLNYRIREVTNGGIIFTVAGSVRAGDRGDGGPATNAQLAAPTAVAVDRAGNLLIADWLNHRLRAVLTAPPAFRVSPSTLGFAAEAGGTPSRTQRIFLEGSIPGLPFVISAPSWISAQPARGTMPATVEIVANPAGLSVGSYRARISATSSFAQPNDRSLDVTLDVAPAPQPKLGVKPASLTFSFGTRAEAATETLTVGNDGGGTLGYELTVDTSSGGSWLSVLPVSGSATPGVPSAVSVQANPRALPAGTYSGQITIAPSAGPPAIVPVTMTINDVPQRMQLSPAGLTFTAVAGGGGSPAQTIAVLNPGKGFMQWSAALVGGLDNGIEWLAIRPSSGATTADAASPTVEVRASPGSLPAGVYYAQIEFTSGDAENSPQVASVVLNVLPAGSDPGPTVLPSGMVFTAVAGGVSPSSQTVQIANLSHASVTFSSGTWTQDGAGWLTYLPGSGTIAPAQAARIVLQPDITGLAAGVYQARLTLGFSAGASRTVNLLLVVAPPGSVPSARVQAGRAAEGDCPTKLLPVFTSLSSDLRVVAGWPNRLIAQVVDDCGRPLQAGTVVAEFSNNEPPQVLASSNNGVWSGTWQVRDAAPQVTIKVTASNPERNLTGSTEVTIRSDAVQDPPVIASGGVVSTASLAGGAPLSPGDMISIFGARLSQGLNSSSQLPLPAQLGTTTVSLAGRQLPLFLSSDGRVNAMVPYGVPVNTRFQLVVKRGSSISVPEPVTVAAAQPSIFTKDQSGKGQGVILDQADRYCEPGNPARAQDVVILHAAGLGEVNPPSPAGSPAPTSPLSVAVNPVSVTIGGVQAEVLFSGLAPGLTGLFQIRFKLPDGVPTGDAVPVVITSAGQPSPPVTMAIR